MYSSVFGSVCSAMDVKPAMSEKRMEEKNSSGATDRIALSEGHSSQSADYAKG